MWCGRRGRVDEEGRAVCWAFDMTCQSCGEKERIGVRDRGFRGCKGVVMGE